MNWLQIVATDPWFGTLFAQGVSGTHARLLATSSCMACEAGLFQQVWGSPWVCGSRTHCTWFGSDTPLCVPLLLEKRNNEDDDDDVGALLCKRVGPRQVGK
jgi:hypothetical protein